jgi:hypothetical protein
VLGTTPGEVGASIAKHMSRLAVAHRSGCRAAFGVLATRTVIPHYGASPTRDQNRSVRAGFVWHWEPLVIRGTNGHGRPTETAGHSHSCPGARGAERRDGGFKSPIRLPRALRTLAHEAVVTEDGPHPATKVEPSAQPNTGSSSAAMPLACHSQRS